MNIQLISKQRKYKISGVISSPVAIDVVKAIMSAEHGEESNDYIEKHWKFSVSMPSTNTCIVIADYIFPKNK